MQGPACIAQPKGIDRAASCVLICLATMQWKSVLKGSDLMNARGVILWQMPENRGGNSMHCKLVSK